MSPQYYSNKNLLQVRIKSFKFIELQKKVIYLMQKLSFQLFNSINNIPTTNHLKCSFDEEDY